MSNEPTPDDLESHEGEPLSVRLTVSILEADVSPPPANAAVALNVLPAADAEEPDRTD